jgi:hypothetical protein
VSTKELSKAKHKSFVMINDTDTKFNISKKFFFHFLISAYHCRVLFHSKRREIQHFMMLCPINMESSKKQQRLHFYDEMKTFFFAELMSAMKVS